MILVASLSFHDSDLNDLSLPVSKYPLLTADVYLVSFLIWISIILVVKCIKRAYLLPFKVFTYNVFNIGGESIILRNVNCNESDNYGFSYFMEFPCPLQMEISWRIPWLGGESVEDWYGKKYLKKHKGMYKWKSWNNKIKKHLSLTSDASLIVIVFRMN